MPQRRIEEVERLIAETRAEISRLRDSGAPQAELEKCLSTLARLSSERLRLMASQRVMSSD